ncbi:MAG: tRNA (adenosine(37)-N6)-threonylcarbamoyltransferase complex ATPase subunit type 1 TsaE [Clostridiales bacterium]|nr:tRNA (adenosine(37)-N6)-threonylcarbamoyltransferase complex ATPase subunit type 1 TsaE [Clostridiales bacterium]
MTQFFTSSPEETEQLGYKIGKSLNKNKIIALYGGLGMGKTALTRGIVKGLDSQDDVSSPTFALVNEYKGRFNIYHFDMYRVNTWDDLYSTGFFDYIGNGVLIIEWSENIENALPPDAIKIYITRVSDNERAFESEGDLQL